MLEAGKSGLLHVNLIEPHSRTVENVLYESDPEQDEEELSSKEGADFQKRELPIKKAKNEEVSPVYEILPEDNSLQLYTPYPFPMYMPIPVNVPSPPYASADPSAIHSATQHKNPCSHQLNPAHLMSPSANHRQPSADHQNPSSTHTYMYIENNNKKAFPSKVNSRRYIPHPTLLKMPALTNTSVPCIASYSKSCTGIPPHPSSKYFQKMRKYESQKPSQQKIPSTFSTMHSHTYSEPTPHAYTSSYLIGDTSTHTPVRAATL